MQIKLINLVEYNESEPSQVTGGGSGLGREICLELARRGCKLAVVDVNSKGCYETVELLSKIPRCVAKAYKVRSSWNHGNPLTSCFCCRMTSPRHANSS